MTTLIAAIAIRNQIARNSNRYHRLLQFAVLQSWIVLLGTTCAWIPVACAQQASPKNPVSLHPYLRPNAIKLEQILRAPCDQRVENAPLSELVGLLSTSYNIPIWIDRRIPIDTPVTNTLAQNSESTLGAFLENAASHAGATLAVIDNTVMIVPIDRRDAIEKSYWDICLADTKSRWTLPEKKAFEWSQPTAPAEIAKQLFTRFPILEANRMELERDLWRPWSFQGTSPAAMSICVLSGFDRLIEFRDHRFVMVTVAPGASEFDVTWYYDDDFVKNKIPPARLKAWKAQWPQAKHESVGQKPKLLWKIDAPPRAHRELVATTIPSKTWEKNPADQKVFSGQIQGQLGGVIQELAARTQTQFEPMPLPDEYARMEIKISLDKSNLDDILRLLEQQTQVRFQRNGNKILMVPPKQK